MRRLDSIVAELLAGAKARIEVEKNGVAANDNVPNGERFARIVEELGATERPRNRRRKRGAKH